MSKLYEFGNITSPLGEEEITIRFNNNYTQPPVVKITPNVNVNVYISEITNTYIKIAKSNDAELDIHYIVIER